MRRVTGNFERAARKATAGKGFRKAKKPTKAQKAELDRGLANALARVGTPEEMRAREKEAVQAKMREKLREGYRPPELADHAGSEDELVEAWWALFDAPPPPIPDEETAAIVDSICGAALERGAKEG